MLRLALFDCDGTLVDSEYAIVAAMDDAFAAMGILAPAASAIRANIGLSVQAAVRALTPNLGEDARARLAEAYRDAYFQHRTAAASAPEPLFEGILDALDQLRGAGWQLGIATGKSMRGLTRLLDAHGIGDYFATLQTADMHPSKPDPAMALAALDQCLVEPGHGVMIGDTSFDMGCARAAGMAAIGVGWGYHNADALRAAGAMAIAPDPADLPGLINDILCQGMQS